MKFDEILKTLGDFGKYQQLQYLLVCLASACSAWHTYANSFVSASSDHYCRLLENQTYHEYSQQKNCTIPYTIEDSTVEWSKCDRYNITGKECANKNLDLIECDNGWV
ncbi:solute carrier family 22 member 6-B-like, partial [Saccoglossus kowalevskii]